MLRSPVKRDESSFGGLMPTEKGSDPNTLPVGGERGRSDPGVVNVVIEIQGCDCTCWPPLGALCGKGILRSVTS